VLGSRAARAITWSPRCSGFDIGVELGQLAIVGAFSPSALALRRTVRYRSFFWTASDAMCVIAIHWSIQRALS
jgi:hypothetical protein